MSIEWRIRAYPDPAAMVETFTDSPTVVRETMQEQQNLGWKPVLASRHVLNNPGAVTPWEDYEVGALQFHYDELIQTHNALVQQLQSESPAAEVSAIIAKHMFNHRHSDEEPDCIASELLKRFTILDMGVTS